MQPLVPSQEQFSGRASSNWQVEQYHAEPSSAITPCWDGAPSKLTDNFNLTDLFDNYSFDFHSIQTSSSQQILSSPDLGITQASSDVELLPRVEFMAKRLAIIPGTFVQNGHTIFIHRMQFQQNPSVALHDAMSACALYCMRGAMNQALVFGNLELKCQQLIASTNALLVTKTELLAALQALLLYQIIRLFDGDIRLRAHAEADESVTISWAAQLNNMIYHEHQDVLFDLNSTEMSIVTTGSDSNWNSWLVNESIRRTVIATFMLNGVYNFLKLGYYVPTKSHQCFTAQAALWGAQSAHDWTRAREETARLEIWVTRWDEKIANVKPADLEEFGVLVMTMLWGLEATQTWLGNLHVKYGFEDKLEK
ncbi:putative transcription factor cys6 protein [Botrytis fragariae]|uniref:Putative transcription factor cys6 protein n=1 Tax=Botrytis fragariae TaxID=1964551 RepID=A0A8H6AJ85_9HELO|nr:putative transcription factor cys6 protein [Botrytis fragariae]KAF5868369.1 putative transcription factor cys6 protein [Botrytis fragariae]